MAFDAASKITTLLEPVIESMGYECVGVVWMPQSGRGVLRIYIDKEGGVTIDDCTLVSRQVSSVLDVEDAIAGEYNLEVSSPGIERPLFKFDDYQKFMGKKIKLRLKKPIDARRNWQGQITAANDNEITLAVGEDEIILPFDAIDKAHLLADW